jgi:hypothetical protein
MIRTLYAALLALLLFLGFTVSVFAQDVEITVERAESRIYSGFRERIYIDNKSKLTLTNGSSGKITVPAGEHTIYAELYTLTTGKVKFIAAPGLKFVVTPHSMDDFTIALQGGGGPVPAAAPAAVPAPVPAAAPVVPRAPADNSVEGTLMRGAEALMVKIPPQSRVAIVYVTARDAEISEFIAGELEFIMVGKGYTLIDRSELDRIRNEQALQMSGEVDDTLAVSIGKIAGANVIVTGAVTGSGDLRRLRLRALSTESGQVLAVASERY